MEKYHHGNLRNALIETGIEFINQHGEAQLSLRKVAAECGVSNAAPYAHFKNKSELLAAMQEYITQQLQTCIENAYEQTPEKDSRIAVLNIGKAYVMFFIDHPQYYQFLFTQPCVKIDLSFNESDNEFLPFKYYKEKSYSIYKNKGLSEERIKYGIIAMWAKVHGIAAIASMKYVERDFEWENVLEKILIE